MLRPTGTTAEFKAKYANSLAWRLFAKWITRNAWIRRQIADRQGGKCAVCGLPLEAIRQGKADLHHCDYDWTCTGSAQKIRLRFSPTRREMIRERMPDCTACFASDPAKFEQCATRLAMVHITCHGIIHDQRREWL